MSGITLLIILVIYLLPGLVAAKRDHPNKQAIMALDVLLGWTFLGWVAAMVWALTISEKKITREHEINGTGWLKRKFIKAIESVYPV